MLSSGETSATPGSPKSTPASSPPAADMDDSTVPDALKKEEEQMRKSREKADLARDEKLEAERQKDIEGGSEVVDTKFKALEYLLSQSKLYSSIMLSQMQKQEEQEIRKGEKDEKKAAKREEKAEIAAEESQRRATRTRGREVKQEAKKILPVRGKAKSKKGDGNAKISDFLKKEDLEAKAGGANVSEALKEAVDSDVKAGDIGIQDLHSARQPGLVTGGTMRSYQLEGLEWLTSLYENGLNGILADEMGLGKTIQTIAFLAFLREKGVYGPFLIAAPLSTTMNWVEEVKKWTPNIPVILYHGSKLEREQMRMKKLKKPGTPEFPIVVTSYEICMNDRKFLAGFGWKFIIIDEGHRIKNLNCRLVQELQSYQSANRLLITGTPLQNNLTELWSLLHFLMPNIFDKLESFESWFDFSALKQRNGYEQILSEERKQRLVASLHAILKPFLLRRVKADVEKLLPPKREYVLYAPLTPLQRDLYQAILDGSSRSFLEDAAVDAITTNSGMSTPATASGLKRKNPPTTTGTSTPSKSAKASRDATPASSVRSRRTAAARKTYEEVSDDEFFDSIDNTGSAAPTDNDNEGVETPADDEEVFRSATLTLAKRQIRSKKLQNPVMQLRLCCNSPHNFFNPFTNPVTGAEDAPDESLVTSSGKMMLLDTLLPRLLGEGHKVLIFSQFKTQLDILEDYCTELRGWGVSRIDGSTTQGERQRMIRAFNRPVGDAPKAKVKAKAKAKAKATPKSKPKAKPSSTSRSTTRSKRASSSADELAPSSSENGDENGDDDDDDEQDSPTSLFLLSTRAGGVGINLAAADTVILFDSDWNPQQDLQAQDRAHRIGQTRPVLVFRLATRNTVEATLLENADAKRRLEKLVIRKGGLKGGAGGRGEGGGDGEEVEELERLLRRGDGERWDVEGGVGLGEEELGVLLDRSQEAYERAERGLEGVGSGVFRAVKGNVGEGGLLEGLKA